MSDNLEDKSEAQLPDSVQPMIALPQRIREIQLQSLKYERDYQLALREFAEGKVKGQEDFMRQFSKYYYRLCSKGELDTLKSSFRNAVSNFGVLPDFNHAQFNADVIAKAAELVSWQTYQDEINEHNRQTEEIAKIDTRFSPRPLSSLHYKLTLFTTHAAFKDFLRLQQKNAAAHKSQYLFDIWLGHESSYHTIINKLKEVYLPFDKPFVVEITNQLYWQEINHRIKYLAGLVNVLIEKKWVADNFSAPDWRRILHNTFNISFDSKPFQPNELTNIDLKYKEPFINLPTNLPQ